MLIKFLYLIFTYLCGSVPFAYIITKAVKKVDIRKVGSGNPGSTNVFRTVGAGTGFIVFFLDTLKGFIPVYCFSMFIDYSFLYSLAVAASAVVGHMFSVFLNFKGGKGVATGLGAFSALMPLPCLISFTVFGLVFLFSGYVALGSIIAAVSLPLSVCFSGYRIEAVLFSFAASSLIIYKHKANIERLRNGTENRFKIFKRK
ncbi:MAG: glycerol-3-phosphate 1-O-acyltransferase PlsY [Endomicrobium sp.]|jgi:glycerol-3-phosphate acyltransferase PlsY|nr:glycerol-3-phosphate 1-O-acyltransferase PlsY [Endomicrobium sp.]